MGQPRQCKHGIISIDHPARAYLGYKVPAHTHLLRTLTGREEQDGGCRVTANSPHQLAIPLPLFHTLPSEQYVAYSPPATQVDAAANYNAAHQAISKGIIIYSIQEIRHFLAPMKALLPLASHHL